MHTFCFDVETFPITDFDKAPKIVCAQFQFDANDPFLKNRRGARSVFQQGLENKSLFWLGANIAFDFACAMREWPEFTEQIFALYDDGRVIDVCIYEKFIMLAKHGYVDSRELPSGKTEKLFYNLGAVAYRRLGIVLEGKDDEDSWRKNFFALDGWEIENYPPEAVKYALDDVRILPLILQSQLAEGVDFGAAPLTIAAAFALNLMTCQGVDIDPVERARVKAMVASELTEDRIEPLYRSGILRRPEPPREYKTQPGKFTQGKPASLNKKVLQSIIEEVCKANNIPVQMTDGGKEGLNPQISTSSEFMADIDHLDPRLVAFSHRQSLAKIVTTELPRISKPRVHPHFDSLKETGRTSSFNPNIQNVDPRVRGCYVPPKGWVFLSVDYSAIELVTLAQKLLWLFGESLLAKLINEGSCPHAFLGARLAWEFDQDQFVAHCEAENGAYPYPTPEGLYEAFLPLKKSKDKIRAEYFVHWRTFAKPVGLGYPGGLGPDTFITFAKAIYKVIVDRQRAAQMRDIWFDTFPEMRDYFNWVNTECSTGEDDYAYLSPAGMLRNHCSYCACANGAALQTPAAEGGKIALWTVVRNCFDPAQKSILYGCRPWAWVHDQCLLSIPEDDWMHERASEVQNNMVSCMKQVIPDVQVKTEACLMRRWDKRAKTVLDARGRLVVWEP